MKRGLVVSGGGSKGAFAGGIIEYLYKEKGLKWDVLVGTSTGSLIIPLTSIGEIDRLKEFYTNVSNDDIFDHEPYNKKNKLNYFNAIWRVILGKTSIGSAGNLKKTIPIMFTENDYKKSIELNTNVIVTTTNITTCKTEYKSQLEEKYTDFCEWMFASASFPILFDIFRKNNYEYADGGVLEPIPLQRAVQEGCEEIDVIILSAETTDLNEKSKNMFSVVGTVLNLMFDEISKDDVVIGKIEGEQSKIKINIYRVNEKLTNNSIIFNKEEMTEWWSKGYEFAKDGSYSLTLEKVKSSGKYKQK